MPPANFWLQSPLFPQPKRTVLPGIISHSKLFLKLLGHRNEKGDEDKDLFSIILKPKIYLLVIFGGKLSWHLYI